MLCRACRTAPRDTLVTTSATRTHVSGASPQRGLRWASRFPEVVPEIDANPEHRRLNAYTRALLPFRRLPCWNKHGATCRTSATRSSRPARHNKWNLGFTECWQYHKRQPGRQPFQTQALTEPKKNRKRDALKTKINTKNAYQLSTSKNDSRWATAPSAYSWGDAGVILPAIMNAAMLEVSMLQHYNAVNLCMLVFGFICQTKCTVCE